MSGPDHKDDDLFAASHDAHVVAGPYRAVEPRTRPPRRRAVPTAPVFTNGRWWWRTRRCGCRWFAVPRSRVRCGADAVAALTSGPVARADPMLLCHRRSRPVRTWRRPIDSVWARAAGVVAGAAAGR